MQKFRKVILAVFVVLLVGLGGFSIWASSTAPILPVASQALVSDQDVTISGTNWLSFTPQKNVKDTGLIFYPGGKVDYHAYAPYAHELARNGYTVVIVRMPLNLAVLGWNKANDVISDHPEIENWVIGGHSLGGAMAAHFVNEVPGQISGLLLLAAYPAGSDDLTAYTGSVLSVSANLDGLATPENIDASRVLLPPQTQWLQIQGGNHAGFGYYGDQKGDNQAKITREEQQRLLLEGTLTFLADIP